MMKICQVVPCFFYEEHIQGLAVEKGYHLGGVEKHAYNLSRELSRRNQVNVLTTRSPRHNELTELRTDYAISRISRGFTFYSSSVPLSLIEHLDPKDYDIIHAHTPNLGIADLAALRNLRKRTPFVLTYHNDISKEGLLGGMLSTTYNNIFGRYLLKHSDIIIATTQGYASNSQQLKKHHSKIRIIPNGVDTEEFRPGISGETIRRRHNIGSDSKMVLFVGCIDHYKGCDYLLSSFCKVLKEVPDAFLVYVGSGPLRSELEKQAKKLGIDSRVVFTGYVRDDVLPLYYAACDLFVLPSVSSHEGFGMVQLEAMASAKPVISTTLPGVRDVDPEEVATVHVPPKDDSALSAGIVRLLKDDPARAYMGDSGRKLVLERYSWKKVAGMTQEVYGEAIR
jgi:glycosyltransferase involved in cell wall biosynthesis